jgi:HK97 family phage major capsid protein
MRGASSRFDVDSPETRALPTGIADLIAAGLTPTPYRVDTTAPVAPTPLLDAMTTINVSTNAIEYVAWTKTAGGAAKVAEKAAKPSAEYGPSVTSSTLDMIAVYTQLTRQLMEDETAVRSAIDNELRREILRAEEAEAAAVLAGATLPTTPVVTADQDLMSAIRVGIGTVQSQGYNPNAVLLNPADWAGLDLFLFQKMILGPSGPSVGTGFWGLTPISATSQPAGTATVGDFRAGVQHYARSQVQLYVTDSHADTFLANVFTLLAERRSKTAVVRPAALCECTATTGLPLSSK